MRVPGSFLLLVFGQGVGRSFRVLQRPLLAHGLLVVRAAVLSVGHWVLGPVRRQRVVLECVSAAANG